ncbi:MAG: ATP-dependent DNA ligase [Acidobacteria bacterium]|nr:MAG: ATP-dependent DNA ligase [Acidobacteriota bacterium]REK11308.1 MAG: ATP-dependent DNA ligase [Acidobacteriota bacterium]
MLLARLVDAAATVASRTSRSAKIEALADLLRDTAEQRIAAVTAMSSGVLPTGRIGIGPAAVRAARPKTAAERPGLSVDDLLGGFAEIAAVSGKGAKTRRQEVLRRLLEAATPAEQDFVSRLLLQELRQGALEGLMVEAIAAAFDQPGALVRRAAMLRGDLPSVASIAAVQGRAGLESLRLEHFRPVQPMLASPVDDLESAWQRFAAGSRIQLEHKLDGARVQVHRDGDEVRVYSRQLNDVSTAVPELIEQARALPGQSFVLDGESFAHDGSGTALPFQVTMRRFGRRADVAAQRIELPLRTLFFDCLERDGEELLDAALGERRRHLEELLGAEALVPILLVESEASRLEAAEDFFERALDAGLEGLMAKDRRSVYEAGSRGFSWLKIKPVHTLDLVVLAAEWGSGRRRGWLSNLHLGARDPEGGFVMLGKTFKGLTDEMLAWQTRRLQQLATQDQDPQSPWVVRVRPELVVEIAFNNVQSSSQYPGGMALRFARVKRYRPDRGAEDATTVAEVREVFEREHRLARDAPRARREG